MVVNRKTRLSNSLSNWLSFNKHRKRIGAKAVLEALSDVDYQVLRKQIVEGDSPLIRMGADRDLLSHLTHLREEFIGQAELLYYHARLIVLLRRAYKVKETYSLFEDLWRVEGDFLRQHLSMRWLVSAADSIADFSQNEAEQALALNVSVLANTVKLYETERYVTQTESAEPCAIRLKQVASERVALQDGMAVFAVGTDDTLLNLKQRLTRISDDQFVGGILREIFARLQEQDTVYARFRRLHHKTRTQWW